MSSDSNSRSKTNQNKIYNEEKIEIPNILEPNRLVYYQNQNQNQQINLIQSNGN